MIFPVSTIERFNCHRIDAAGIKASNIDTVAVRIRARNIERLDATISTEKMFGDACVELIGRDFVIAANEREIVFAHNQVYVTAHAADTAIALVDLEICRGVDFKSDAATVATAFVNAHLSF